VQQSLHNRRLPTNLAQSRYHSNTKEGWSIQQTKLYRNIPTAVKIYKMLLNHLKPHLEKIFRMNQNDFREGRSTVGQILALRRITEEVQINNIPAVLDFTDYCKAFNSISRGKLFQILASYGIPETIITTIINRQHQHHCTSCY